MAEARAIGVVIGRFEDLVARGLRSLIEADASLELLAADVATEDLDEALGRLPARVAIIALDALPSPIEVRRLVARHPGTELVLLAERPSRIESAQLLAFGAAACLTKATQERDVLNAVHLASRGMQVTPREPSAGADPELLTPREADVLTHLQHRRSNAQIAADLHISIETVRTHARSIYRKLGVGSRRELAPAPARR
jgi:DNA-binding NarL/FixJ family response regulator